MLSPWSLPELSPGYGLILQELCETPIDTTFVALPGKWPNLSFNPSFDAAFLNNHGLFFISLPYCF